MSATQPRQQPIRPELARTFAWIALLGWALFALVPIVWLLLAATKSSQQLATEHPFAFGSFENVTAAWNDLKTFNQGAIIDWIWNTVYLTGASVALTVLATIPAGYALGAHEFRLRKPILLVSLALMLMPSAALVLPLFLEMTKLGLIGNRLAVILPMAVFPFGVYLAFIYYSTTVSRDTYDAARLDGCNEWQVFRRIALPLSRPIVALVTFFSFIKNWNDFFLPYIMLTSDKFPLPVGLATLASTAPELHPSSASISSIGIPEVIVAALITMTPVMLAIIVAQRSILRGASVLGGGLRG